MKISCDSYGHAVCIELLNASEPVENPFEYAAKGRRPGRERVAAAEFRAGLRLHARSGRAGGDSA